MDFPLELRPNFKENSDTAPEYESGIGSNLEFVYGMQELKNDLYLLLKTPLGRFLQDLGIGTTAVPHTPEDEFLVSAITRCCEQLNGVTCKGASIIGDRVYLDIFYKGNAAQFDFSITSLSA